MSVRKQTVVLRGFAPGTDAPAMEILTAAGYQIAQTLAGADLLVVGTEGAEQALGAARQRQLPVATWVEMQARLRETDTVVRGPLVDVPLFEFHDDHLRLLDLRLPWTRPAGGGAQGRGRFATLCFDEPFLRCVRAVALGALHGFPTALEGPTAASKTTAVLWLADLLGQPVVRLNLNGQTDTGELTGRYVPAREGEDWDLASLEALGPRLQPVTRQLLTELRKEGRPPTWGERVLIGHAEGVQSGRWRFREGVIPQAMRQGHWVLMDELNLAEPQILERLNPVLENPSTLVLSEGDGTTWGPGGLPVHPRFRLFSTMNPAEYAGRSVLSPAFRDRWTNWFQTTTPGEREYLSHLRLLVLGVQPEVVLGSCRYQGPSVAPAYPELADVPDVSALLHALARFHVSLAQASVEGPGSVPTLGRSRRERYVFSRRVLSTCVQLWAAGHRSHPGGDARRALALAVESIYIDRFAAGSERKAARGMAQVAGLSLEDLA